MSGHAKVGHVKYTFLPALLTPTWSGLHIVGSTWGVSVLTNTDSALDIVYLHRAEATLNGGLGQ